MKYRRTISAVCLVAVLQAVLSGCSRKQSAEQMWLTMGTYATVTVPPREMHRIEECLNVATSLTARVENSLSLFMPDSDLSRLNASDGRTVAVNEDTRAILAMSIKYGELTDGCFDSTVTPLVRLWGFNKGNVPPVPPSAEAIHEALQKVGFRQIILSGNKAAFRAPGMEVDSGGIAKGYAVDLCHDELARRGVKNVMINVAGNLRVRGTSKGGRPWRIGVRDPFDRERLLGTLELPHGMAVSTSGNYERFVVIEGRRYAHIIDPRTGIPVEGMAGVTALCTTATEADAMSTALFVLGPAQAPSVLSRLPDCHALLVPDTQPLRILVTPGFRRYFTPVPDHADRLEDLP